MNTMKKSEVFMESERKKVNSIKNVASFSKEKLENAKNVTSNIIAPKMKEAALATKESISNKVSKVSEKAKNIILEDKDVYPYQAISFNIKYALCKICGWNPKSKFTSRRFSGRLFIQK